MTDPDDMPHLLVIDDDERLRDLLRRYLSRNGFRVTAAQDAQEARSALSGLAFDLLILDVMMPGETGLELTHALREGDSTVPILLLTAMGETADRIAGLSAGADDYLAKPFEPQELLLRIQSILRRAQHAPAPPPQEEQESLIQLGAFIFDLKREILTSHGTPVRLSTAEAALLKALALSPRLPLSREDLAQQGNLDSNPRAIDVQVTRLRRKIEPDPKTPIYLQTVRGMGYVLHPD